MSGPGLYCSSRGFFSYAIDEGCMESLPNRAKGGILYMKFPRMMGVILVMMA